MKTSVVLMSGICCSSPLHAMVGGSGNQVLSFFHTHTAERLTLHHRPGSPSRTNLRKLNHFLRDFRTGDVHPIDEELLDILSAVKGRTHSRGIIEVVSGYRSPQTNQALRKRTSGVAKNSLHMEGRAIDLRIRNCSTRHLRDVAIHLHAGGVGYYAASDFVHLDTGKVRTW